MTSSEATRVDPDEPAAMKVTAQHWCAESLQMVNWGGFDGHHKINFAQTATLLSGASGTGKSTLLDAYIALMMDSNTPFNGASNDNVIGRARGAEQRNVLSYVRGKLDTSRESGTGTLKDDVLRGVDTSTWSAVGMTWQNDAGERFTALRVFYAPVSARVYGDITPHLATINRFLDLRDLEEFTADRFQHTRLCTRIPGLKFHEGYSKFAAVVHTKLGIGAGGDGGKALKLLARIQGGRQVATVDDLYKTMVLERPQTYAVADRAIAHFDDLKASYQTMKNAEEQVHVLEEIPTLHQKRLEAEQTAALIDTFQIHSTQQHTLFRLWSRQLEARLIETEIGNNRTEHDKAKSQAVEARGIVKATERDLEKNQKLQQANGGDALEEAEHTLKQLEERQTTVVKAMALFDARIEVLDRAVNNQAEFDALQAESKSFLATVDQRTTRLDEEYREIGRQEYPLLERRKDLEQERKSLQGRDSLVPDELHSHRVTLAQTLGLHPEDDLPFVAELIDMAPAYESWREAAELALGGFAITMLVDECRLGAVRRAINSMRLRRRLRFEGVELNQQQNRTPERTTLPGRFVTKDTPFTPWLMNRLVARFDYTCVDSAAELDRMPFGLTITGQTRERRRGAHGGHGAPRVIGFSNECRLQEIEAELEEVNEKLIALEKRREAIGEQRDILTKQRDAYRHVIDTNWVDIDEAALVEKIAEISNLINQLLENNDVLTELKQTARELEERIATWRPKQYIAEHKQQQLDEQHEKLMARESQVNDDLWLMEDEKGLALEQEQQERLDAEFARIDPDAALASYERSVDRLRDTLATQSSQASKDAEGATQTLRAKFDHFQSKWPRPNLGVDSVRSYDGYRAILDELIGSGLHERRAKFSRSVNEWSGQDLLRLHGSYQESIEEIETRLGPVNDILAKLPFGAGRDRLHINLRRTEGKDIAQFRHELKILASGTTEILNDEQVEKRFLRLQKFMERIRESQKASERDHLIDVRRHVYIEAQRRDTAGRQLGVYTSLGGKSGGESQELVAFIVGAALRYQLGDADLARPRYAPVFLDEGFVKSDSEFAGRAVNAWRGLGFQLIIGTPNDKVTAIEPHVDLLLHVIKNDKLHSHVRPVVPTETTPGAASAT